MVRSFILNDEQREAIEEYLRDRPNAMSPQVRQIRLRAKRLDFNAMQEDIKLLERLAMLKLPKGRKSADMLAVFRVGGSPYDQVLNKFVESNEKLSIVSIEDKDPAIVRQRLNRLIERSDLPVKAQVINKEVYLERTDIKLEV